VPSEKRARQRAAREAKQEALQKAAKRRSTIRRGVIVAVVAAVVVASIYLITRHSNSPSTSSTTTTVKLTGATTQAAADKAAVAAGCPASTKTAANTLKWPSAPAMTINTSATYLATVTTTAGTFTITLDASKAPTTVNNFVFLAQQGFYHCVLFHRVIPGFMDQTGDPTGTGGGGPGYTIPDELPAKASDPTHQYALGAVAMANTGQPNTGGSQWFVVAGPQGEELPGNYATFGQVTSGMNVVEAINQLGNPNTSANGVPPKVTQRILSITISTQ
jgi:cyclophilin family peptidyl-prolyl cis-trans isomerase